jgi:Transient receptor potential (TRP) ion channel
MGVAFFLVNVIFATVILLMVIWSSVWALVSKNPDTRYQPMRDDRGSFIKSQTNLGTTELDALGATARGDKFGGPYTERKRSAIDDDDDQSFTSSDVYAPGNVQNHSSVAQPGYANAAPRSPIEPPSAPMMKSSEQLSGPPSFQRSTSPQSGYSNGGYQGYQGGSPYRQESQRSNPQSNPGAYRQANNASPWQRGVGY